MSDAHQELTFDESQGILRLGALRHLLLRPETLCEIQKGVEDRLGTKAAEFIYAAGASWAVAACKRLKGVLPDRSEELAQAVCAQATALGWGHWKLQSWQPETNRLAIQVISSPLAESYGASDGPVCHLLAGAVAGLAESLLGMPTSCVEQACRAQGGPGCLLVAVGHDLAAKDSWQW